VSERRRSSLTVALLVVVALGVLLGATYTYTRKEANETISGSWAFTALQTFSGGFKRPTTKIVEVCVAGCEFTTLNAACAANTSTAASPIEYRIGPGTYSSASAISCSGEDHPTFAGAGRTTTTLVNTQTGFANYGTLELGTSKNVTIKNMRIEGHRGIWWDPGAIDIGTNIIENVDFKTQATDEDEDCLFLLTIAGQTSTFYFNTPTCNTFADGFTFGGSGGGTTTLKVYNHGTRFFMPATISQRGTGWAFGTTPCWFQAVGDQFNITGTKGAAGTSGIIGYSFLGDTSPDCGTSAYAWIVGATGLISNTGTNGQSAQASFVTVVPTQLTELHVQASDVIVKTSDATSGQAYGVTMENNTTTAYVEGGRIRATGGLASNTFDLKGGTTKAIITSGLDFLTEDPGRQASVAADVQNISASKSITMTGCASCEYKYLASVAGGSNGFLFDNTLGSADNSPSVLFSPGGSSGTTNAFYMRVNSSNNFELSDGAGNKPLTCQQALAGCSMPAPFALNQPGAFFSLGDSSASDGNHISFLTGTNADIAWKSSQRQMRFAMYDAGGMRLFLEPQAAKPANCAIGDIYVDTSGAYCACTVAGTPGTWVNLSGTGTCV
jgi:hypothetical protein